MINNDYPCGLCFDSRCAQLGCQKNRQHQHQQQQQDFVKVYEEYLRKQQEKTKPAPALDYDKLADLVAAKVVALLAKKKRRASR